MDLIERLQTLCVRDVMSPTVVQVSLPQSLADVARVMHKHHVSLVPVVDEQGRAQGVLSAFDFVARESRRAAAADGIAAASVAGAEEPAAARMSTPVRSVSEQAPLLAAARLMCDEHLHRLLVLDAQGRPRGVISMMDVISALLNAMDELRASAISAAS